MVFDPDSYINSKTESPKGFDPDSYISTKSKEYGMGDAIMDVTVNALPLYGQALGSVFGPPGAGAGQAAGESLKQGINSTIDSVKRGTFIEDNLRMPTKEQVIQIANQGMKDFNEGATFEMGGKIVSKAVQPFIGTSKTIAGQTTKTSAEQAQKAESTALSKAGANAEISGGGIEVEQSGKLFDYRAPESLDELRNWKPESGTGEVLGKTRLKEIVNTVSDLKTKPLKYHFDMMENPKAMKELKLKFENLPTGDAKRIATYNQEIVNESGVKVKDLVSRLTGGEPKSLGDAGENLLKVVRERKRVVDDSLAPAFKSLREDASALTKEQSLDLAKKIGDETNIGSLLSERDVVDRGTGLITKKIFLKKNLPRSGVSDKEYSVISRVINDLNEGMTFPEIQKVREFLRKSIDPANPAESAEIGRVRKVMLNALENMTPNEVQPIMKQYAINQRAVENIEDIIGGKIETLDAMFAANPDRIVQKIFANPNQAQIVRGYVGPQVMDDMIGSYINNGIRNAFDSANGFNPVALRQWIKSNNTFLKNYVDPNVTNRLSALADYGYYGKRFLDEVNPSGTAASLKEMFEPKSFSQKVRTDGVRGAIASTVEQKLTNTLNQRQATSFLNEALGDVKVKTKGSGVEEIANLSPEAKSNIAGKAATTAAGIENQNKKGPEKWADNGAAKLKNLGISDEKIAELRGTKKGKDLLIRASDLGPESKAMKSLLNQLNGGSN